MATYPPRTETWGAETWGAETWGAETWGAETSIRVERTGDGGRVRVISEALGGPERPAIRPMLLASDAWGARISLVPEGALLLDGDAVSIRVEVGPGATLQLVEPAGTVAYDMRGGVASWEVSIEVAAGATLAWHGEPFVAAAGSQTARSTRIVLAEGSRLMLRETLVLGRHAEQAGRVRQSLDVRRADGTPVLADALDLAPGGIGVLLGGNRVVDAVLAIGTECVIDAPGATRFELEAGGTLFRALSAATHQAPLDQVAVEICSWISNSRPLAAAR